MLIVLELPLKDIAAVGGVDFLDGQLLGVLNGLTVDAAPPVTGPMPPILMGVPV